MRFKEYIEEAFTPRKERAKTSFFKHQKDMERSAKEAVKQFKQSGWEDHESFVTDWAKARRWDPEDFNEIFLTMAKKLKVPI